MKLNHGFPRLVAKTLDKIPASQIQQYTKRVIYYDEVCVCVCVCVCWGGGCGYVQLYPRMQVLFNIHKSINIIYYINKL